MSEFVYIPIGNGKFKKIPNLYREIKEPIVIHLSNDNSLLKKGKPSDLTDLTKPNDECPHDHTSVNIQNDPNIAYCFQCEKTIVLKMES